MQFARRSEVLPAGCRLISAHGSRGFSPNLAFHPHHLPPHQNITVVPNQPPNQKPATRSASFSPTLGFKPPLPNQTKTLNAN